MIPDIAKEPDFLDRTGARGRDSHVAFLCVPILHKDDVIGTMSIDRETVPGVSLERDLDLLEIVANLMADAISVGLSQHEDRLRLIDENTRLKQALERVPGPHEMTGNSPAMQTVYRMIEQVAASNATVLIRGASGTGKELAAKALQRLSNRADKPFVIVNSAALPENLIESELFGHEKGSFTGAVGRRIGRIEAAEGGTLFLDEIGDLGPATQVKLLRFLQERTYQRVGSNEDLTADVRILAATSRNLEKSMAEGRFREDLYYRLNVFPITMPDLAARRADIPLLANHFLVKCSRLHGRRVTRISPAAMALLTNYSWPGNVRELENCIERSVLTATDDTINSYGLPEAIQAAGAPPAAPEQGDFVRQVEAFERKLIEEALQNCGGNVAAASRVLNLTPRILHYKLRKLEIDPQDSR